MTPFSRYSPRNGGAWRRAAAPAALCAGALAVAAGCTTGATGPGSAGPAASLTPKQAITLAADVSHRVTSMAATFSQRAGADVTTSGTMQLRLKPSLLARETVRVAPAGHAFSVTAIVSTTAIYLKAPTRLSGKSWVKISFSRALGGLGRALQSMLQNAQADNPTEQSQLLTASKDAREVGRQVVDGVQTTHYAGTFALAAALAAQPPAVRRGLAPVLKAVSGTVRFNVWIDDQHVTRRLILVETVGGQNVTTTLDVTAVNQPVRIALPPASQVSTMPLGALSGT